MVILASLWLFISSVTNIEFYSFLPIIMCARVLFAQNKSQLFNLRKFIDIYRTQTNLERTDEIALVCLLTTVSIKDYKSEVELLVQLCLIYIMYRFIFLGTGKLVRDYFQKNSATR